MMEPFVAKLRAACRTPGQRSLHATAGATDSTRQRIAAWRPLPWMLVAGIWAMLLTQALPSVVAADPGAQASHEPASERSGHRPLPPPKATARTSAGETRRWPTLPAWDSRRVGVIVTMFAGLIILQRVLMPKQNVSLPTGAVQVCGKVPLDAKQSLHLVRVGERLLVLLESPQGTQRVAEIDDPLEVQNLLSATHSPAIARAERRPTPSRGDGIDFSTPRVAANRDVARYS